MPHPYLSARSLACLAWTSLRSRRSALVPTNTMSGLSQYALAWSWPKPRGSHLNPCDANSHAWGNLKRCLEIPLVKVWKAAVQQERKALIWFNLSIELEQSRQLRWHILIQFLTLRKLCWLVRSNISRKPMASLKKAVVRLRNLKVSSNLYKAPYV